ncbi:MAG: LptF/LptG family permease, partial [Thiovulaceae bacterium]|nr:LptF/LptG family permease [Sulfurimonadaceae bacterium]
NLFFKYDNYYIYFSKLFPIAKTAEDIRIFKQKHSDIVEVIKADKAFYRDDKWFIPEATKIIKQIDITFDDPPMDVFQEKDISILEGFRPTILDHIHEGKVHYSIIDAIEAIDLLNKQESNADKVISALYSMVVYPLFVPALLVIVFFFVPISSRSFNVSMFTFAALLSSLLVWGVLFAFTRLSHSGTFTPEQGVVYPILAIYIVAIIVWFKKAH